MLRPEDRADADARRFGRVEHVDESAVDGCRVAHHADRAAGEELTFEEDVRAEKHGAVHQRRPWGVSVAASRRSHVVRHAGYGRRVAAISMSCWTTPSIIADRMAT